MTAHAPALLLPTHVGTRPLRAYQLQVQATKARDERPAAADALNQGPTKDTAEGADETKRLASETQTCWSQSSSSRSLRAITFKGQRLPRDFLPRFFRASVSATAAISPIPTIGPHVFIALLGCGTGTIAVSPPSETSIGSGKSTG